jgi:hypothetical protein
MRPPHLCLQHDMWGSSSPLASVSRRLRVNRHSTFIARGPPTPTKTPTVFMGQSLAKVRSSLRVFFQVLFTNEISRAFFSYSNLSVIAQSMANLLFIILRLRFQPTVPYFCYRGRARLLDYPFIPCAPYEVSGLGDEYLIHSCRSRIPTFRCAAGHNLADGGSQVFACFHPPHLRRKVPDFFLARFLTLGQIVNMCSMDSWTPHRVHCLLCWQLGTLSQYLPTL